MDKRVLSALIRVRLTALLGTFTGKGRNKKKQALGTSILFALLFAYVGGVFIAMFAMLFSQMVEPFSLLGIDWFYFFMMITTSFALMLVGSVFMTYSQIYDAKDNELLLSMPIKPSYITISRIAIIYIYNLIFELLVAVPAFVIYLMYSGLGVMGIVAFVLTCLSLPLLATALSALLGFLIAKVSGKVRNKTIITVVISVVFFIVYITFISGMNNYVQALIANGEIIAGKIRGSVLPVYWMSEAIAGGKLFMLLFTVAVSVLSFYIMYVLISNSFIKLATTKVGFKKKKYVEKEMNPVGVRGALLHKEWGRFISCPTYVMNCGIGAIFNMLGAIAAIVEADKINALLAEGGGLMEALPALMAMSIGFIASMNIITAPSISLEGKTLWILRHSPVKSKDILDAKILFHLLIALGSTLVLCLSLIVSVDMSGPEKLNIILFPISANILCALVGIISNLVFPKFDWISETVAVKQSASVFMTMFGMMAITFIPIIIFLVTAEDFNELNGFILVTAIIFLVVDVLLYALVSTWGVKRFEKIQN